jgi:hypothetical protein
MRDDTAIRRTQEGTRYLLLANGAVLVASISGLGTIWNHAELHPPFEQFAQFIILGFEFSMVAWIGAQVEAQGFFQSKQEIAQSGYSSEAHKFWREYNTFE